MKVLVAIFGFALFFSGYSRADSLSVNLTTNCATPFSCQVSPFEDGHGSPAAGSVNFNPAHQGWNFSFETANPTNWTCLYSGCQLYEATFGAGGTFLMTASTGQTFTGQISHGNSWAHTDETWGAEMWATGRWNTGQYGTAHIVDQFTGMNGWYGRLVTATGIGSPEVPEPSTLLLLGGGLLVGISKLKGVL